MDRGLRGRPASNSRSCNSRSRRSSTRAARWASSTDSSARNGLAHGGAPAHGRRCCLRDLPVRGREQLRVVEELEMRAHDFRRAHRLGGSARERRVRRRSRAVIEALQFPPGAPAAFGDLGLPRARSALPCRGRCRAAAMPRNADRPDAVRGHADLAAGVPVLLPTASARASACSIARLHWAASTPEARKVKRSPWLAPRDSSATALRALALRPRNDSVASARSVPACSGRRAPPDAHAVRAAARRRASR